MGKCIDCEQVDGTIRRPGQAMLETDMLEFRGGGVRTRVKYADITGVETSQGILSVRWPAGALHLDLGEQAEKWADKLLHPPSRTDKLDIKRGDPVHLMGDFPADFGRELDALEVKRDAEHPFWILYLAPTVPHLHRLPPLGTAKALWIVYPKKEVPEKEVLQAGRSAGLNDIKVMRFSDTHTALKFIPRKRK